MPDGFALPYWPASMREDRAAAYLDVSATYFRQRIAPKLSPIRPSSGVVLYLRRDLDAWLDQQSAGNATSAEGNPWHQQ
jgi:hypothetical protein